MNDKGTPCIIVEVDGRKDKVYRKISRSEYKSFKTYNSLLRKFELSQDALPLVDSNAKQLDKYIEHVESKNHPLPVSKLYYMEINNEINRLFLNFASSVRLYLDHTETRLKKMYGNNSCQYNRFKSVTSDSYDNVLGYRFLYKLRNYIQHCGMAAVISSNFKSSKGMVGHVDMHSISIEFDPKKLLSSFNGWSKKVREDLESAEGNMKARGLATTVLSELRFIDRYTYMGEIQELEKAGRWIVEFFEGADTQGDNLKVGIIRRDMVNIIIPAFDVMRVLGVVEFNGDNTDSKDIQYFPMFGHCFKMLWIEENKSFTVTCPTIPELLAYGTCRESAMDNTEIQFKLVMKEYLEKKKDPPIPLLWRHQYMIINKDMFSTKIVK